MKIQLQKDINADDLIFKLNGKFSVKGDAKLTLRLLKVDLRSFHNYRHSATHVSEYKWTNDTRDIWWVHSTFKNFFQQSFKTGIHSRWICSELARLPIEIERSSRIQINKSCSLILFRLSWVMKKLWQIMGDLGASKMPKEPGDIPNTKETIKHRINRLIFNAQS